MNDLVAGMPNNTEMSMVQGFRFVEHDNRFGTLIGGKSTLIRLRTDLSNDEIRASCPRNRNDFYRVFSLDQQLLRT